MSKTPDDAERKPTHREHLGNDLNHVASRDVFSDGTKGDWEDNPSDTWLSRDADGKIQIEFLGTP